MATEWYYTKGDEQIGPLSISSLKAAVESGDLTPTDLVWKDGMAEWKPAESVKGLFPEPPAISSPFQPSKDAASDSHIPSPTSNIGNTVKSNWTGFITSAKHAKELAVAHARKTQITQIALPQAFLALGKDVFMTERFREEFSNLFDKITNVNDAIAKVKASNNESPQTSNLKAKLQSGAAQIVTQAQATKLRFQRESLVRELGKKAFESHGENSGPAIGTEPITAFLSCLAALDADISRLSSEGKGSWITPKRLAIAGAVAACLFVMSVIGNAISGPRRNIASKSVPHRTDEAENAERVPASPRRESDNNGQQIETASTGRVASDRDENRQWLASAQSKVAKGGFTFRMLEVCESDPNLYEPLVHSTGNLKRHSAGSMADLLQSLTVAKGRLTVWYVPDDSDLMQHAALGKYLAQFYTHPLWPKTSFEAVFGAPRNMRNISEMQVLGRSVSKVDLQRWEIDCTDSRVYVRAIWGGAFGENVGQMINIHFDKHIDGVCPTAKERVKHSSL